MGNFQLNGGTLGSTPDPSFEIGEADLYGQQNNQQVFGPFFNASAHWEWLNDTELTELYYRISSANGQRVQVTMPITSVVSWSMMYANVRLLGFRRAGDLAFGITLEFTRVSASL